MNSFSRCSMSECTEPRSLLPANMSACRAHIGADFHAAEFRTSPGRTFALANNTSTSRRVTQLAHVGRAESARVAWSSSPRRGPKSDECRIRRAARGGAGRGKAGGAQGYARGPPPLPKNPSPPTAARYSNREPNDNSASAGACTTALRQRLHCISLGWRGCGYASMDS